MGAGSGRLLRMELHSAMYYITYMFLFSVALSFGPVLHRMQYYLHNSS